MGNEENLPPKDFTLQSQLEDKLLHNKSMSVSDQISIQW